MAITSSFDPIASVLTTIGDDLNNTITTSRDAAGNLLVNGGAVLISGGAATVDNTRLISVSGQDGNDTITLDESNGALPAAFVTGDGGDHTITGGSGNDLVAWNPGDGSDTVEGGNGVDTLLFDALFTSPTINENIEISANGDHVILSRDVDNVAMDLHGVEGIILGTFGGADNVTIDDVSGTD